MTGFTARALRIRYPAQERWAVDGASLDILPGKITWLTGALGSGTSTLLLALSGLAPRVTGGDREGLVAFDGADVSHATPLHLGIAYLGPSPSLQISGIAKSVADEVAVGPVNLDQPRDRVVRAVASALGELRLDGLAHRAPDALSGGETQRLLLAALLAASPKAWLLDEPFSALDRTSTGDVQRMLRSQAAQGATVVVACDDPDVMLDLADRLVVLQHGRPVLDGDPRDLLAGDAMLAAGAGTTDAATLARDAGFAPPRPLTRAALIERIPGRGTRREDPSAVHPPAVPAGTAAPAGAGPPVLRFDRVAFAYRDGPAVLHDVTLGIGAGEAVGLFGANGAGKSTLLRLAMALEQPLAGSVTTLGMATGGRHPEDFAPRTGFLFQQPERQLFAASVRAECSLAPRLAGWDATRTRTAVAAILEELGLADTSEEHPYDLPVPRRRLVGLASILVADPALVLLDEPTAGLDAASRLRVIGVIRQRVHRGAAVLAITHDAAFAHEALERGVVLDGGRLVHEGPIRSVIDDVRLTRPAALAAAIALGLPPGQDRQEAVAALIRSR